MPTNDGHYDSPKLDALLEKKRLFEESKGKEDTGVLRKTASTIDELEKILNGEDDRKVTILPDGTIAEAQPTTECPAEHPLRKAWEAYRATFAFQNSKGWALQISPMVQAGARDAERQRRFEIMPLEQRERHVEGSLWAAFMAGYTAASGGAISGSLGDGSNTLRLGNQ